VQLTLKNTIGRSCASLRRTGTATTVLSTLFFASSSLAAGGCDKPPMPEMPDGGSATLEQMLEGQKSVKAFQGSNMAYMKCLEDAFQSAETQAKELMDEGAKAAAKSDYTEAIEAYNAAVSAEEEVAGQFNVELREYKAANQ